MRLSLVMIVIPPWITSKIKGLIQKKNIAKKCYFQNNEDIELFVRFQNIQKLATATIAKFSAKWSIVDYVVKLGNKIL